MTTYCKHCDDYVSFREDDPVQFGDDYYCGWCSKEFVGDALADVLGLFEGILFVDPISNTRALGKLLLECTS